MTDTPTTTTPSATEPLPTEPYVLAELIAAASVPETEALYERLQAQLGDEAQADRIWNAALDEYHHGQAHDHAHEGLRQGISAAAEAIRAALGHLGQLTGGDGYCVELADTTDGHDVAALLDQAGRLVRAAGKYLLDAESAETRPSTPFAPDTEDET